MGIYAKRRQDGTTAWYYDFMFNKVRYRGVGSTTKTQAFRTLDKVRSKVLSGEYKLVGRATNPKIDAFAETYLSRHEDLRSHVRDALSVRTLLKEFSGNVLSQITPPAIEDYIAKRRSEGLSNASINRELACLKRMYNVAIKWGDAKRNPVVDVDFLKEPPGRTRFLTEEEASMLLLNCSEHVRPIVYVALKTGMRLQEILGLTWNRVYIETVIDPYLEIEMTKNNKNRFVPLDDDTAELLTEQKRQNVSDSEYVFLRRNGQRFKSVRRPFQTALKRAGIMDFRFHDLRHTFASHFVMSGGELLTLKEILGHNSLKMVERYTHLASAYKRRQINNLKGKFQIATLLPPGAKKALKLPK